MCCFKREVCGGLFYSSRKQIWSHTKNHNAKPSGPAKIGTKYRVNTREAEVSGGELGEGFMRSPTSYFRPRLLRQPHAISSS